jgi:AAA+ ATPase superfamily predicted ATPase
MVTAAPPGDRQAAPGGSPSARPAVPGRRGAPSGSGHGRRRQGKSYLLRRLADAVGGLYHLATEQAQAIALRRFGDSLASWAGLSAGAFGFGGWEQALGTAAEMMAAAASRGRSPLLVIDEFPYLAQETPGLPSIVHGLYDRLGPGAGTRNVPLRLVVCGSAISVMGSCCPGPRRCAAG